MLLDIKRNLNKSFGDSFAQWSQKSATVATFLFSALLHEMIMVSLGDAKHLSVSLEPQSALGVASPSSLTLSLALFLSGPVRSQAVCFRFVRFYLLFLMLLQIPLVALGRYYAHNRCLANAIFWACLLLGRPSGYTSRRRCGAAYMHACI